MENLKFNADFSRAELKAEEIAAAEAKVHQAKVPHFALYEPDLNGIQGIREKYAHKKFFIVEGNGGSVSSLRALKACFRGETDKQTYILDTDDPDYIAYLKKICPREETLLLVINRSGNNIQTVSGYLALRDYDTIFITANGSALHQIGQKHDIPTFNTTEENPEMAGRFSGNTEFALIPAALMDIEVAGISAGAKAMYEKCAPTAVFAENPALQAAAHLDKLEHLGYTELFLSIYSKKLTGFWELITQLLHESICKEGMGQTVYGGDAPENQHHTLQRFTSGRKNSVGFFITVKAFNQDLRFDTPEDIAEISCRGTAIEELTKLSLGDIMHTEFQGTWRDVTEKQIPALWLEVAQITPQTVGELIAFWQYVTYYSALLRDVNPFNQPGVEQSKEYIFELVKNFSKE